MTRMVAIIGAQKARTSTLAAALERHPAVFVHPNEPVTFENPYARSLDASAFVRHLGATSAPVAVFKRADLLGRPESPGLLRDAFGCELTVVASLRNPVDRAVSAYIWYVRQGLIAPFELNAGLQELLERGRFDGFPRSGEILDYSCYATGLERYADTFGTANLFVRDDRSWDRTALPELGTVLGLDGLGSVDQDIHLKPGQRSVVRARFTATSQGSTGVAPDWRRAVAEGSPLRAVRRRMLDLIDRNLISRMVPDDVLTDVTRQALAERFRPEVDLIRQRFGIDLDPAVDGAVGARR